ncbi:NAD(P)-binding domain-containing protein, partial [Candidatus Gribaldobacteria bacterium]|nr:NAD(P)-binding domain-containing protein [Candidatus Gribaldobacteria bacterium]
MSTILPYKTTTKLETRFVGLSLPFISVQTNSKKLSQQLRKYQIRTKNNVKLSLFYKIGQTKKKLELRKQKRNWLAIGSDDLGKLKTALRNISFAELKKKNFILLHATCVKIKNDYFVIAGEGGSGKTTYAKLLKEKMGTKILVNDYLFCQNKGGTLIVSDINFKPELKHQKPITPRVVFVSMPKKDYQENDVWRPTEKEFPSLFFQTLSSLPDEKNLQARVENFWGKINWQKVDAVCINTKKRNIEKTYSNFARVIKQIIESNSLSEKTKLDIAVVGLGTVGAEITSQLINKDYLNQIYIYNRTQDKAHGLFLDFTQASQVLNQRFNKIVECKSFEECLKADFIIICIRETKIVKKANLKIEERMAKVLPHIEIFRKFAKQLRRADYQGKILVVSNPIEILAWALYYFSNLNRMGNFDGKGLSQDQIYGVGLELDKARAELAAKNILGSDAKIKIEPFIQHGENLCLRISGEKLTKKQEAEILGKTLNASPEIRKFVPRTIYGPATAMIKSLEGIIGVRKERTHLSAIYQDFVLGIPVEFRNQIPRFCLPKEKWLREKIEKWKQSFA